MEFLMQLVARLLGASGSHFCHFWPDNFCLHQWTNANRFELSWDGRAQMRAHSRFHLVLAWSDVFSIHVHPDVFPSFSRVHTYTQARLVFTISAFWRNAQSSVGRWALIASASKVGRRAIRLLHRFCNYSNRDKNVFHPVVHTCSGTFYRLNTIGLAGQSAGRREPSEGNQMHESFDAHVCVGPRAALFSEYATHSWPL